MQKLIGLVRRCIEDYKMIEPGDRIAVGVSGGKDSLALLVFLAELRKYHSHPFEVEAITIDLGMGMDYSGIRKLCEELNVPFTLVETQIGPVIFEHRKESNPCSLCAKICPVGAISGEIKKPFVIDSTKCIKCGACQEKCRFNAISRK